MQETRRKEAGKQKISNITDLITNFLTLQKKERAKRKLPYHKMYPNVSKMYLNLIVQKENF